MCVICLTQPFDFYSIKPADPTLIWTNLWLANFNLFPGAYLIGNSILSPNLILYTVFYWFNFIIKTIEYELYVYCDISLLGFANVNILVYTFS